MASERKKNKDLFKIISIFIAVFVFIPLGVLTLVYFTNDNFRSTANESLRSAPGLIGEHFRKYPTKSESKDKELYLAKHYITLENNTAADKLYIIKSNDEQVYNNIIKSMNSENSSKTSEIIKLVRNIELRKDILISTYDTIIKEKEALVTNEVKRIENMDTIMAISYINENITEKPSFLEELESIFSDIREDKGVELLLYLDSDLKNQILARLDPEKKNKLKNLLSEKAYELDRIKDLSLIYEAMEPNKAFEELGSTDKYSNEYLANIYVNLSVKQGAEILVNSNDNDFTRDLFNSMTKVELMTGKEQSTVGDILRTMNYLKEYNGKIEELIVLYEKMQPSDAVKIVEKMIVNKQNVTSFQIDSNPIYQISDSTIILDVLKGVKKNTLSEIISKLDSKKAAEITRDLAVQ